MKSLFALVLAAGLALGLSGCGKHSEAQPASAGPPQVLHLDSTVLNLADPGGSTYVRLGVTLALGAQPLLSDGSNQALVTSTARDTVLEVTTSKQSGDLLTPEGKAALKAAILARLRQRLPNFQVSDLYFDEFLVQH